MTNSDQVRFDGSWTQSFVQGMWSSTEHHSMAQEVGALRIAMAGNCSTDFSHKALQVRLRQHGISPVIVGTEFNNWIPSALGGQVLADIWIIWCSSLGFSNGEIDRPQADLLQIASAVRSIRGRGVPVILIGPEILQSEVNPGSPFGPWRRRLAADLEEATSGHAVWIAPESLQMRIGLERWNPGKYWTLAKTPCHPDAACEVGRHIADVVVQCVRPRIRAIITDLDNTIWKGILGEIGSSSLDIDKFSAGAPFVRFQRVIQDLRDRGLALAIASKNDIGLVKQAFQDRSELLFSLQDFVHVEASWERKSSMVSRIMTTLNFSTDAVVFLDDNAAEREEIRHIFPDMLVLELSRDPEDWALQLTNLVGTWRPMISDEDNLRHNSLEANSELKKMASDPEVISDYLINLCMSLECLPISEMNIDRVSNLVEKTNQFNLSNSRLTRTDILQAASSSSSYAFTFRLSDRFGDHGLVASAIGRVTGSRLRIESWVVSCRVFSRGIEAAILDHILQWCRDRFIEGVEVVARETSRNALVFTILDQLGLIRSEVNADNDSFYLPANKAVVSHHLSLRM